MTGEWTALERRRTSTSVTVVHVIICGDLPQCFCWRSKTMTALTGCRSGFLLSLEVVRGFMSHLSHRLPPASPPLTPELLKVITEPVPKLILEVILKYFTLFSHCLAKHSCRSSSEGSEKECESFGDPTSRGQLFTNTTTHTEIQLIASTTEIARVLEMFWAV